MSSCPQGECQRQAGYARADDDNTHGLPRSCCTSRPWTTTATVAALAFPALPFRHGQRRGEAENEPARRAGFARGGGLERLPDGGLHRPVMAPVQKHSTRREAQTPLPTISRIAATCRSPIRSRPDMRRLTVPGFKLSRRAATLGVQPGAVPTARKEQALGSGDAQGPLHPLRAFLEGVGQRPEGLHGLENVWGGVRTHIGPPPSPRQPGDHDGSIPLAVIQAAIARPDRSTD